MANACCPVSAVLETSRFVVGSATTVQINRDAVGRFCQEIAEGTDLVALRKELEWETCGWHFADGGPPTAQYVFVLDSLNFCFWPVEGFEYEHLAGSLRDVLTRDPKAFDAGSLRQLTEAGLQAWFPTHELPNCSERVLRLRELGEVLHREFDGEAAKFSASASGSAVNLVQRVIEKLPGFRDTVIYKGRLVHFYKRAQILVSDLWAAFGRRTTDAEHFASFGDMERLTMFADYRVPQLLRHVDILTYTDTLAAAVDSKTPVPFGSDAETEIRAATVVAVDEIQQGLRARGVDVLVVEVDWMLWNRGERDLQSMAPHHRTLTIYY